MWHCTFFSPCFPAYSFKAARVSPETSTSGTALKDKAEVTVRLARPRYSAHALVEIFSPCHAKSLRASRSLAQIIRKLAGVVYFTTSIMRGSCGSGVTRGCNVPLSGSTGCVLVVIK